MGYDVYKEFRMMIVKIANLDEVRKEIDPIEEMKIK